MANLYLYGYIFIFFFIICTGQELCLTSSFENGRCIPKEDCPSARDTDQPSSVECQDYVMNPRVCCPIRECVSPEGKAGVCTKVRECPRILRMIRWGNSTAQEDTDYLKKSLCDPKDVTVCCATESEESLLPKDKECPGMKGMMRILGGESTTEYPWMVLLEYKVTNKSVQTKCGGSLINRRYVLTAAHCVQDARLQKVRLGEYDTSTVECPTKNKEDKKQCSKVIRIWIERVIPHPYYNKFTMIHDIALLRLKRDVVYSDTIKPICLSEVPPEPSRPEALDGVAARLTAAGWGATETGAPSTVKLEVQLPPVKREDCERMLRKRGIYNGLWKTQICAGGEEGHDTCSGDSGGPLMAISGARWRLVGITSYGDSQCGTTTPAVYTSVYPYLGWIRDNMQP